MEGSRTSPCSHVPCDSHARLCSSRVSVCCPGVLLKTPGCCSWGRIWRYHTGVSCKWRAACNPRQIHNVWRKPNIPSVPQRVYQSLRWIFRSKVRGRSYSRKRSCDGSYLRHVVHVDLSSNAFPGLLLKMEQHPSHQALASSLHRVVLWCWSRDRKAAAKPTRNPWCS